MKFDHLYRKNKQSLGSGKKKYYGGGTALMGQQKSSFAASFRQL